MKTTSNIIRRAACALLVTLLTTMTAFAAVGDVVGSGKCGTNLTWTLTDNGGTVTLSDGEYSTLTLTITGTGAMYDYTSDTRPWGIADNIRYRITTLNLPEGITHIGNQAFYFTNFSGPLVIPSTVKTIGASGFYCFYGATSVTIPASVTSIGEKGLLGFGHDASSCTVTFAEGSQLSSIGAEAFNGVNANLNMTKCTKLTAITAEYVFRTYTKTVTFPKTMTSVCANAFKGSTKPTVKLAYQGFLVINGEYQSYNANGATSTITSMFSITSTGSKAVTIFQRSDGLAYNTEGSYYEVNSEQGLVNLGDLIEADKSNAIAGMTFKLTADLDFTNMPTRSVNDNSGNFHPIGLVEDDSFDGCFSGHFDGQNHTIKALRYTNKLASGTNNIAPVGLFKKVDGSSAVVERVVLIDPQMSGTHSGCGGVAGGIQNGATIRNCTVLGGSIVYTANGKSGGIVGSNSSSAATIEGCTVIGTSVQSGMIIGYANSQQTIKDCIYYTTNNKGITQDTYTDGGGNQRVYEVTLGENVTATGAAFSHALLPGKAYYAEGATVNLGHDREGYVFLGYTATGVTLSGSATSFTMPANDVTIGTNWADPTDFSVNDAGDEYTIHTTEGWNVFCDALQDNDTYNRFSGKTVRLGDDITVTRMAGGENHEFTGTFDGGGKTLTVNYANTDNNTRTAPFSYVDGATIQNLIVGGTISGTAYRAAGIIGETVNTTSHITNCVSNVDISSGSYTGGFSIGGNVEIEGCVFNGKIKGTTYSGGFIGYSYSAQVIKNSLFAPQDGSSISGGTFYYNGGGDITPTNSYYTRALGTPQGKATRTVTAGDNVTIGAIALTGTATQYTVSGITAYSGGGLQRGQTLYYGIDDQLSLTLTTSAQCDQLGYQYTYTASAGTLSGTTLTMPDDDVTISVNTAALAPIDWATVNQGNSKDPYMIYNKDQLLLLAHRVNGTSGETANEYEGKYFKLGADITFSYDAVEGDDYDENYEAIGGYIGGFDRFFMGNFDGDGYTVSGIRIRKTGTGNADYYQGLFGYIADGANIHDVHLTDARIKGYKSVGGIVGYNTGEGGYISGCTVTDSYITATGNLNHGTICGGTSSTSRLTNNYYHGCTVNGTAVTSGKGCQGADIAANHGALPAYRLALGANITTPPGTFAGQTEWLATPPVDPRLAPENGFTLAGNHYFASGYVFTPGSTLASGAAQGYTPRATLGGQLLALYTPTGDDDLLAGKAIARLTITADCDGKTLASTQAIYSTGQPVTVAYIKADGNPGEASAVALDGTETSLAAGWYFVGKDISYTATLTLGGDVNLILADGCTMNIGSSGSRISGNGIALEDDGDQTLTIYGQNAGTGALSIYTDNGNNGIAAKAVTINGGHVTIDANGNLAAGIFTINDAITINNGTVSATATGNNTWGLYANRNLTINGGNVNATGGAEGIRTDNGDITINGGNVSASGTEYGINASYGNGNITLGWTRPTDRITASSISAPDGGTVAVADGQALTDGSGHIYTGTLSADDLTAISGKTLQPCLVLNETDGVNPLTAFAGQANVPVIFARTFSANVASTICLPFAISADQATAAGKFYTFAGVNTSGSDWVVTMQETDPGNLVSGELTANTPYLFMPSASSEVTFSGTIGNVANTYTAGTTTSDDWKYKGTYETIEWKSDPGKIYGFASGQAYGNTGDETAAGTFIRVRTGGIRPFRAYLQYSGSGNARAMSGSASNNELPETMTVRLIGADGQSTAIGTLDTRTGEATFFDGDAWYTLDGRRLSGKPAAKGLYIKNGKKTVIK